MKRILIINQGFSNNLGDQAIGITMDELVTSFGFKTVCVGLGSSNQVRKPLSDVMYQRGKKRNRLKTIKALLWMVRNRNLSRTAGDLSKFDAVLIGGGELIQDNNVFPYAISYWIRQIKKANPSTPIYLFGVGVTSKFKRLVRVLLKKTLKNVSGVYARDSVSAENIRRIFGIVATEIPDVVFASDSIKPVSTLKKEKYALLGITSYFRVAYYNYATSEDAYYQEMYSRYCCLKQKYGRAVCIYSDALDRSACLDFAKWCKERYNMNVDTAEYRQLNEMVELLGQAEYLESPRMHACIIATLCNIQSAPIVLSPKMQVYKKKYVENKVDVTTLRESIHSALRKVMVEIDEKS